MNTIRRFVVALSLSAALTAGFVAAAPAPLYAHSGAGLTRFCTALANTITDLRAHDGRLAQALANLAQAIYDQICK